MRRRPFFIILVLLLSLNVFSQENWIFFNTSIDGEITRPESVIPIVDKSSGNLAVVVMYKKSIKAYLYGANKVLVSEMEIDNFPKGFKNLIGSCSLNSRVTLFFENGSYPKVGRLSIDFENKSFKVEENLELDLKKEYLIDTFEEEGKVFLLSILKDSSILKLSTLDINGDLKKDIFDLSQETFERHNHLKTTLYYLITNNQDPSRLQSASITYNTPNSLEMTSSINKIYFKDGVISITNDYNASHTYLIQINTKDKDYSFNSINKKGFLKEELRSESNSFIFENLYFSFYVTTSKMVFAVYDIKKNALLNEYKISDNDSISFKNSPIIKSKGKYTKVKDANHSGQFLRILINSNVGVSVYEKDESYVVTLGASEKVQSGTFAIIGGVLGGFTGAVLLSVFDAYSQTESTRIECLFDKNFNHIEGDVPLNGFDKIKTFIDERKLNSLPLQTVFLYKDAYIFGSYNKTIGLYSFYRF